MRAMWILPKPLGVFFRCPLYEKSYTVLCLPVHLDQEEVITFTQGQEREKLEKALNEDTMLKAWFGKSRILDGAVKVSNAAELHEQCAEFLQHWQRSISRRT